MLKAYRRCDEKRFTRIEILRSLMEMSKDALEGIATLHTQRKPVNASASPAHNGFTGHQDTHYYQGAQGGA